MPVVTVCCPSQWHQYKPADLSDFLIVFFSTVTSYIYVYVWTVCWTFQLPRARCGTRIVHFIAVWPKSSCKWCISAKGWESAVTFCSLFSRMQLTYRISDVEYALIYHRLHSSFISFTLYPVFILDQGTGTMLIWNGKKVFEFLDSFCK